MCLSDLKTHRYRIVKYLNNWGYVLQKHTPSGYKSACYSKFQMAIPVTGKSTNKLIESLRKNDFYFDDFYIRYNTESAIYFNNFQERFAEKLI